MKLKDWYDGYDHGLKEFSCPKCNKIHAEGIEEIKKWVSPE